MTMVMVKDNLFRHLIGISALFVAGIAGFFSVMGIGMLFSGTYVSAIIMATSLEIGKIVATSFLYRYWTSTEKFLRMYLVFAVVILMVITSMGIFGWLSSGFQTSASEHEQLQRTTESLVEQKKMVESERNLLSNRISVLSSIRSEQEKRLNDTLNNSVLSRNPTQLKQLQDQNISLIRQTDTDIQAEQKRYRDLSQSIFDYEKQILISRGTSDKTKDIVTFQFVSDTIGFTLKDTVKWFIIVIILVFDPLAICLILAYNVARAEDSRRLPLSNQAPMPVFDSPVEDIKKN